MNIILLSCLLAETVLIIWWVTRQERQISDLIDYLSRVQDRLELPELPKMKEGNLGILQSEIYKVVALLRESYSGERRQKQFLSDMLSDISHQIKTPLTAVSVMTDLLAQSEENCRETIIQSEVWAESDKDELERRLEYISKIKSQVNKITWLIRNLLTISRLEADVLELKRETVVVEEMLSGIRDTFEILAEVKMIQLKIKVSPEIEMVCDRKWTMEAISNIVKNCIEHTGEGGTVTVRVTQDNLATHIHISDTGVGISKEHLPHIFERFYKTDSSSTDSVGIGLAMAKQIVLKQDGTISVESREGDGTDFYIKMYRHRNGH